MTAPSEDSIAATLNASAEPAAAGTEPDSKRWWALAVIALAQLMVVLDATVVNIALPDAQKALGMSDTDRQWVVTAYALAFGGLLLLGGRIADFWGRKRTFVVGMAGFAIASAIGGIAHNSGELFAARALQGVFGALLAPASLSLLQVTFAEGRERAKAFGVYGAIAGGGAAVGLVLGGVLTEYASWRWCLLVNIPVALLATVGALGLLNESKADGDARYDIPGAISVSLGLGTLVYGFTKAAEDGWGSRATVVTLTAAVILLIGFVLIEQRSNHPLLPLRIALHPTRGGVYLTSLLAGAALLGGLLFLTYYFQITLRYSPLKSGLATLPLTASVLVTAGITTQLMMRVQPKLLMVTGPIITAVGMAYLTRISTESAYVVHVLPALLLIGIGLALLFVPLSNLALVGVSNHDAGAASALVNATQQVGGALGTALFSTIYASAVGSYLSGHAADQTAQANALVHGYTTAFGWAAAAMIVAAVIAGLLIRASRDDLPTEGMVHLG